MSLRQASAPPAGYEAGGPPEWQGDRTSAVRVPVPGANVLVLGAKLKVYLWPRAIAIGHATC